MSDLVVPGILRCGNIRVQLLHSHSCSGDILLTYIIIYIPGQIQDKALQLHQVASQSLTNGGSSESLLNNGNAAKNGTVSNGSIADKNKNKKQMQVHAISNGFSGLDNQDSQSSNSRIISPVKSSSSPVAEDGIKMQSSSTRNSNHTETTLVDSTEHTNNTDVENANNNTTEVKFRL